MRRRIIEVIVGVILFTLLLVGASYFTDLLGARTIKKGSPRLAVARTQQVTLELVASDAVRKLELCTDKKRTLAGYREFFQCQPLKYFVLPRATKVDVRIPNRAPLGRVVVITRVRDDAGRLVPMAPNDEKIALYVTETVAPVPEGDGGGSSGGGGGSSGGGGGSTNSSAASTPDKIPPDTTQGDDENTSQTGVALLSPRGGRTYLQSGVMEVQVELSNLEVTDFNCQRWLVDGREIKPSQWLDGNSPDKSAGSC